ncbi:hypothetical protein TGGT1_224935 [Toxoplasma gondii GT1]|uniref:Transmembrane protein n=2 Tax=Toxoplasma gondii TaxID=5811 RepID=S7W525_TOXGG|nr:hypothetical protein TGGT1_224935 [Toxoplasma gondii GT1]KAF4640535.1 hypothetical protein TGRH88_044610 [Toxoplasma gondii]
MPTHCIMARTPGTSASSSRTAVLVGRLLRPLVVCIFLLSYLLFLHGILFPVVDIQSGFAVFPGSEIAEQTMAMPQTLQSLWDDQNYIPLFLVAIFSLFVPCLKLVLFCIVVRFGPPGETVPEYERMTSEERECEKTDGIEERMLRPRETGEDGGPELPTGDLGGLQQHRDWEGRERHRVEQEERGDEGETEILCHSQQGKRGSDSRTTVSAGTLSDIDCPSSTLSSSHSEMTSSTSSEKNNEGLKGVRQSREDGIEPHPTDDRTKVCRSIMGFLLFVSKYQLVDVYVYLFMILFVHFPLVRASPLPAAFSFLFYCLLSIVATECLTWIFTAFPICTRAKTQPRGEGARSLLSLQTVQPGLKEEGRKSRGERITGASIWKRQHADEDVDGDKQNGKHGEQTHTTDRSGVRRSGTEEGAKQTCAGEIPSLCLAFSCSDLPSSLGEQPRTLSRVALTKGENDERKGEGTGRFFFAACRHTNCEVASHRGDSRYCYPAPSVRLPLPNTSAKRETVSLPALASVAPALSHLRFSEPAVADVGVCECFIRTLAILLFTVVATVSARAAWCLPLLHVVVTLGDEKEIGIDGTFLSLSQLAEESLWLGESISGFVILILFPLLLVFAHLLSSCLAMFLVLVLRLLHPEPWYRRPRGTTRSLFNRWCWTLGLPVLLKHLLSFLLSISQLLSCWAMADVFAIGLFTAYFTINAVHVLVAHIPSASPSTPEFADTFSCLSPFLSACHTAALLHPLDAALPARSGFWGAMIFGASASQLHLLLPSRARIDRVVSIAQRTVKEEDQTRFLYEDTEDAGERGKFLYRCSEESSQERQRKGMLASCLESTPRQFCSASASHSYSAPSFLSAIDNASSSETDSIHPLDPSPSSSFCGVSASGYLTLPVSPSQGGEGGRGGFSRSFFRGTGLCKRRRTGFSAGRRAREASLFSWSKFEEETPQMSRLAVPLLTAEPAVLEFSDSASRSESVVLSGFVPEGAKNSSVSLPFIDASDTQTVPHEKSDIEQAEPLSFVGLSEAKTNGRETRCPPGLRTGPHGTSTVQNWRSARRMGHDECDEETRIAEGNRAVEEAGFVSCARDVEHEQPGEKDDQAASFGWQRNESHPWMCRRNIYARAVGSKQIPSLTSSLIAPQPSSSPVCRVPTDHTTPGTRQSNPETAYFAVIRRNKQAGDKPRHLLRLLLQVLVRLGIVVALSVALVTWPIEPPRLLDLDKVNAKVVFYYPMISRGVRPLIPASVGDCTAESPEPPPEPCVGHSILYHYQNAYYEATARWVSGVNTTEIEEIRVSSRDKAHRATFTWETGERVEKLDDRNPAREEKDDPLWIAVDVSGRIAELNLSLRIGQCLTPDSWRSPTCDTLWDNTTSCCGKNITFAARLEARCTETPPTYLSAFSITEFRVSSLTINESVLGLFSVTVANITDAVEQELKRQIQTYLEPDNKFIPWDKDTKVSLQALVNHLTVVNAPGGLLCRPPQATSGSRLNAHVKHGNVSNADAHDEF